MLAAQNLRTGWILETLMQLPEFRHLQDPEYFSLDFSGVHSPLLLPDMELAVLFLKEAMEKKQTILIVGDRDVDGVSSTALIGMFLRHHHEKHGGKVHIKVSDAGDDYGLSGDFLKDIQKKNAELVILMDMGSTHGPEIETLIQAGSRVIVLDHHQIHERAPSSSQCAFINPMRLENRMEHDGKIATVGLVFKLLFAYALSFTRDWKTIYLIKKANGSFLAYRCAKYMGEFETQEEAKAICGDFEYQIVDPASDAVFRLTARERELIEKSPLEQGKILLSRIVRARARMLEFVLDLTDITAVGLITDMVPLVGENRALVRMGLGLAGSGKGREERNLRPGYRALLNALDLKQDRMVSRDLGWSVGPALNAAGRMGDTALALDLLMEDDPDRAKVLALKLRKLNEARKTRTSKNESIVEKHFEENGHLIERPVIFCYHPELESGVSGIIATRLLEKYNRPVVYINPDGKHAKGSVRAQTGLNCLHLLEKASAILLQYGGHPEAAGFSLAYENIPALEAIIHEHAEDFVAGAASVEEPRKAAHLELTVSSLSWELFRHFDWLEPFGPGNPEVLIQIRGVTPGSLHLPKGIHAIFRPYGSQSYVEFVLWKHGAELAELLKTTKKIDVQGHLEFSSFRRKERLVFRIASFQPSLK